MASLLSSSTSHSDEKMHTPLIRTASFGKSANRGVAAVMSNNSININNNNHIINHHHINSPQQQQQQLLQHPQHYRSIDEFYTAAHTNPASIQRPADAIRYLSQRLPYVMCFVSLGITNVGDAAEMGSMRYLLANDGFLQDVVHGQEGVIISALYVGMFAGGLLSGPLCDQWGRRNVLLASLSMNSLAGVACSWATTTRELALYRMVIGFGIGSISSCLVPLASEHAPPKLRGSYINFVNAFKTAGSIYVSVLALYMFGTLDKSWRLYVLVDAIPTVLSLVLVFWFCPESARYLALRGRHEEATLTANRLASSMGSTSSSSSRNANNNNSLPKPLTVEECKANHPATKLPHASTEWKCISSIALLYRNPLTRSRVLTLQALSFLISFGSGISLWIVRFMGKIAGMDNIYVVGIIFASACIPGVLIGGWVIDRVDRTVLLTTSLAACGLTLLILGVLASTILRRSSGGSTNAPPPPSSVWVVFMACLFHTSSVICTLALSLVTVESFSTSLRSTASGLCTACARLASILVHFIIAMLLSSSSSSASEQQNPPATFFLSSACFFVAVVVSAWGDSLENRTGAPLPDFEPHSRSSSSGSSNGGSGNTMELTSKV